MIVVTAPTSRIGSRLLHQLLASGASPRVIVRDPQKLSVEVRSRSEVVVGSHADAGVLERALDGAQSLFWLVPPNPKARDVFEAYVDFSRPLVQRLQGQDVRRVVTVSALGRGTPQAADAGYVTGSLAMDDLIATTGVSLRSLTMPSFMDNLLRQLPALREQRAFYLPLPADLPLPACSTEDIAGVAARWLLDSTWTGRQEVPVLGPENISAAQMAHVMGEVLGCEIVYRQITFEAYRERFLTLGFSQGMAEGMVAMLRAKSQGLDLGVRRTPENSTPTTFRQWCEKALAPLFSR